jgi:hypothetical protein
MTKVHVRIAWDTSDDEGGRSAEELGLPTDVVFDVGLPYDICKSIVDDALDGDYIVEMLTDRYGWCIESFWIEVFPPTEEDAQ